MNPLPVVTDQLDEDPQSVKPAISRSIFKPRAVDNGPSSILPLKIMKEIQRAGASLKEAQYDKGLYILDLDYPSEAYNRWKLFCLPNGIEPDDCQQDDPRYLPVMVVNGGVPLHMQGPVHHEVTCLLSVYAPLRRADFEPGAPLPALPAGHVTYPNCGVNYHHATLGAHRVFERISNGKECPVIGTLPQGCIICRINVLYSNCAFSVRLFKT